MVASPLLSGVGKCRQTAGGVSTLRASASLRALVGSRHSRALRRANVCSPRRDSSPIRAHHGASYEPEELARPGGLPLPTTSSSSSPCAVACRWFAERNICRRAAATHYDRTRKNKFFRRGTARESCRKNKQVERGPRHARRLLVVGVVRLYFSLLPSTLKRLKRNVAP